MEIHESLKDIAIVDFETTGLKAGFNRVIEVAAVTVHENELVGEYSTLMNPGCLIPQDIVNLTGITNEMVVDKPKPEKIMPDLAEFIGNRPIVCHNAPFESRFFEAEMNLVGIEVDCHFLCTLALARRLVHDVDDHKLRTLTEYFRVPPVRAHRAMSDVLLTLEVWKELQKLVFKLFKNDPPNLETYLKLMKTPKKKVMDSMRLEGML